MSNSGFDVALISETKLKRLPDLTIGAVLMARNKFLERVSRSYDIRERK